MHKMSKEGEKLSNRVDHNNWFIPKYKDLRLAQFLIVVSYCLTVLIGSYVIFTSKTVELIYWTSFILSFQLILVIPIAILGKHGKESPIESRIN